MPVQESSILHVPSWDAADELEAMTFIAWHGFYRQALGCLRNAIENLLIAVSYQVQIADAPPADKHRLEQEHEEWKRRDAKTGYTPARSALAKTATAQRVDAAAGRFARSRKRTNDARLQAGAPAQESQEITMTHERGPEPPNPSTSPTRNV